MIAALTFPSLPAVTPDLEALLRLGLAVLCGLAVGLNRAHHGSTPHPNRLRVHVLVGLSAALMVLAAGAEPNARSRAIQGVATGVGFLGAGEILGPGQLGSGPLGAAASPEVRGLSSAASIWFTAALGVTVAASSPVLALAALGLALITLSSRDGSRSSRDGSRRKPASREGMDRVSAESGDQNPRTYQKNQR